jgi:7-keto-8-aminopelargonate synthetase-like enzyme
MFELKHTPGRTCMVAGKEFLFFSGYSYLGMYHVKKFTELVKEGIDRYGILFPSSRISNTRLELYEKFERTLSDLTGVEDTVSFSSGFLAGKTITDVLSSYQNILVAPHTHPAVNINSSLNTVSIDFAGWKNEVVDLVNASGENNFVLISDSVNVLEAEINDFSFLDKMDESKNIICLIDDSHGIGILGKNGEGIISRLMKKPNLDFIISYSLSKAFNIEGGAVSCSNQWAEKLRQHSNFTGSTAINPSLIHAFIKSKKLYSAQRELLFENINYIKKNLPSFLMQHDFDLPVFICKNEEAAEHFYNKGIIISSFGYPDPTSKNINRVVLNALHTKQDLKKLCKASN